MTRIQLPTAPVARFAEYFASGPHGVEWFLAETDIDASVELGRVSAYGHLTLTPITAQPGVRLRGLALDSRGRLWSTESGTKGRWRRAGIVRIAFDGRVTVFRRGLMRDAIPANIARGTNGTMWFTDDEGRIGQVSADGRVDEHPIGRPIAVDSRPFAPMRPLIVAGDRVWFIAGPDAIGEMATATSRVKFIAPSSSYPGLEAEGARDGDLVGLATAPDGDIWFTRDSGEVARLQRDGQVETVTNRLVDAYGIAFDGRGRAWVGEGPAYQHEHLEETPFARELESQMALPRLEPARLAEIDPAGRSRQFPPARSCRVPSLIGVESSLIPLEPTTPLGYADEQQSLEHCDHRIRLMHVTTRSNGPHGRLFVVAQRPASGRRTYGYLAVSLMVAAPSTPRRCRVPRPFNALYRSPRLVLWRVATLASEEVRESYYACVPGSRRVRLVTAVGAEGLEGGAAIGRMLTVGRYVAYVTTWGGKGGSSQSLAVEDVATGSRRSIATEAEASDYAGSPGPEPLPVLERLGSPVGRGVFELALSPTGLVAWVGHSEMPAGAPPEAVLYLSDSRRIRRLAVASRISDLRFSGTAIEWREDGIARSTAK